VIGALFFGMLADRWGRRKLFMITLGVYLVAVPDRGDRGRRHRLGRVPLRHQDHRRMGIAVSTRRSTPRSTS